VETLGPINSTGISFLSELGRVLTSVSRDPRETSYLADSLDHWRSSVTIRWYSEAPFRSPLNWASATLSCFIFLTFVLNPRDLYYTLSSWWRSPSRALPYWLLVAKYPYILPSSMPYGPQNSEAEHPHLLFSARWLVGDQRASSNLLMVLVQQRWHGGGLPQESSEPGVQRTSGGGTSPHSCNKRL